MININGTILIQTLNFLIITVILNYLLFKPLLNIIQKRNDHLARGKKEIEDIEAKTQNLINEILEQEKLAKIKASHERTELKNEAMKEADKLVSVAENSMISTRQKIDSEIADEMTKVRVSFKAEAEKLVDQITEKIIGRSVAV
ncbi:MAG: hypothetical protein J7L16_01750 [Deltaproteobacteria bacterium]|nr:hypothetical protein [Deltaproteobacteria bacterium]